MKLLLSAIFTGTLAVILSGCATEKTQAQLQAMARLTQGDAEQVAAPKVPGGTLHEAELEEEDGKVVWSLEYTMPGTNMVTEVEVDAVSGEILAVEQEENDDDDDDNGKGKKKSSKKKTSKKTAPVPAAPQPQN